MRIAITAKFTTTHLTGGREIHVEELAKGLAKKGHSVAIFTTKHPKGKKHEHKNNVDIYYYGKSNPRGIYRFNYFKDFIPFFQEINKEKKFDIVHDQDSLLGYTYIKHSNGDLPVVVTFQGTSYGEIKSCLNTICSNASIQSKLKSLLFIFKIIVSHPQFLSFTKKMDAIIVTSNELYEGIKKEYKISNEKLILIPNGIDADTCKPNLDISNLKEKYRLQNEKIILTIGVMSGQKGHDLLLKVLPGILKENKNVKLVLVGYGPELNNLKNMAKKLDISENVIFTGKVPHKELQFYYNLPDVFVFPTLRVEGAPLVIPEAMACEKPVIASRIGGIPTVIENYKDGILVEPGNLEELKEKILEVLNDEQLAKKLGENARKKVVEKFSLDKMVEDTIKVYEEIVNKNR